jgi:hypothetical protein
VNSISPEGFRGKIASEITLTARLRMGLGNPGKSGRVYFPLNYFRNPRGQLPLSPINPSIPFRSLRAGGVAFSQDKKDFST